MDPDTIELGWLNEDNIITDDSRVTIDTSSDYFNDSTLVTIIQFDPLAEKDEDEYTCYAVINGSFIFESISLQNIISKLFPTYIHNYACHVRYKSTYIHTCHSNARYAKLDYSRISIEDKTLESLLTQNTCI